MSGTSSSQPNKPADKPRRLTREEAAKKALEHTVITRRAGWILTIFFLLLIYSVPLVEQVQDVRASLAKRAAGKPLTLSQMLPKAWDIFRLVPSWHEIISVRGIGDFLNLLPTSKELKDYETTLENDSDINAWIRPHTQYALSRWFHLGNEEAYRGKGRWLFYRPGVDHLTRGGFVEKGRQSGSIAATNQASTRQPDSIKALVDFKRQLDSRGLELIVIPMPVKPMIEPEKFCSRYDHATGPLHNPAYADWARCVQAAGIRLFDPAPRLWKHKLNSGPQYLVDDTHWTPEAMSFIAQSLADYIKSNHLLPEVPPAGYRLQAVVQSNLGDIALMLKLPQNQDLFMPQQVKLERVVSAAGTPWAPDPSADVLLLGDSFCNIYSLEGMGWGTGAGFVEHLSYDLQRPLDRIVINAGGAYTARLRLAQELARGQDGLADKHLVIYEFAARELSEGDWRLLKVTDGASKSAQGGKK